jgi:hypothetical protein
MIKEEAEIGGKTLRGEGDSRKQSPLVLLRGSPVLQSAVRGNCINPLKMKRICFI